jgi:predicted MFS family arabinose efflux permease
MGFQFQSVASAAPFVTAELAMDKMQLGWLIGLYLLPGVAIALPGGLLGARYGDKRITLAGLAMMVAGGLVLAFADTYLEANSGRLIGGTGAVILNVLFTKMVADWFEGKDRLLAMAILVNSWPIGIGLALLLIGPLGETIGWQAALVSTAIFAACGFAAVFAFYAPPTTSQPPAPGLGLRILTAKEWRLLAICSLPWLLFNAAYQIIVSFLPLFFLESGMSIGRSGAITALNTVLIIVSVQVGGILLKRSARPDLICHAAILGWAASVLLLTTSSVPCLWLVLGGLVAGLPVGAFISMPAEFLRPESRSAGMGVFYTIYYLGCALLPSAAGAAYDATGTAAAALWMAALLGTACIPLVMLFRSRQIRYAGA